MNGVVRRNRGEERIGRNGGVENNEGVEKKGLD